VTIATMTTRGTTTARTADLTGIGERFGLYGALSGDPVTAEQLARRTYTDVHFIKAWLEQQVHEGFVAYDAATCRYANYCNWPRN